MLGHHIRPLVFMGFIPWHAWDVALLGCFASESVMVNIVSAAETVEQLHVRLLFVRSGAHIPTASSLVVGRRLLDWLLVNVW